MRKHIVTCVKCGRQFDTNEEIGLRITKNNWWYFLFVLLFVGCFYFCWWCFVGCCWLVYFMLYAIYKLYYFMFKYAAIGIKKLYALIKEAIANRRKA